ncbi:MAG: (2Fe-2S)-binding protein [Pseudomonadota bacterium]|nr:(2Fe-2S)-binding protein [Pseudomonadota bacterium]MEC9300358.1 (2Fe-2S)-binding protein [Pseudomonadota bacterium]MED5385870.1 (2Fe-2S)-binding protein [Pseudomonadota bacterium]MEE3143644.1 (2Fe-2S)-binding protein [Pseudomonadota bacterium]MEE3237961.1 (2Fe-2S)-binding protein [Pseudomonadota bacterium]
MNSKLTRRRFIKGTIFSGAAVTTGTGFYLANAQSGQSAAERLITLNINGRSRPVDVMPSETLAYTLRYKLDLTGTKIGCNRGECGACTVLIDGVPNYSCSVLTHNVKDKAVISIEGVKAADGTLHAVQQAFVAENSPQCGFCTPGQVMSAVALLNSNPSPTREEVRAGLSGNLCRCGAYEHYINGVLRASGQLA